MSNTLNLFQIKMQISQFVNFIWDQTFGGTDHAKEQINMKMINLHPNIMNMKSGRSGVGSINVPRYLSKSITCCCPVISSAKAQLTQTSPCCSISQS